MSTPPGDPNRKLPLEAQTFLTEGRIIDAIKSVRASHGLGLKEAKDWIDAHIARDPVLSAQLATQRTESRRKALLVFIAIDAVLVAAIVWYFFFR